MASDLITDVLVPLLGELIRDAPDIIDAWIDGDEDAAERTERWIRTVDKNAAADARWWASRAETGDDKPEPDTA